MIGITSLSKIHLWYLTFNLLINSLINLSLRLHDISIVFFVAVIHLRSVELKLVLIQLLRQSIAISAPSGDSVYKQ